MRKLHYKEVCGIEQKNIYQVKQDLLLWAQDKLPSSPQSESQGFLMVAGMYNPAGLSELQRSFIDPDYTEQITAVKKCLIYLRNNALIDPAEAEHLISVLEEKCPHSGVFFASWARARLAVLSCKFDDREGDKKFQRQALEYYHRAFNKGRNFAGAYLKEFLKESIAATVYFNRRRIQDMPKVIDTDKPLKTPITDDVKDKEFGAKQYYEYGYALNFFEQESSKTYFLHFHAEEHFWEAFPAAAFARTESARQKYSHDMFKAKGVYPVEGGKEGLQQYMDGIKTKLENVTEKTINKRMEIQPEHNVQYTPLSIALQRSELDIAERYLEDFSGSLDVTVINTHGSTALSDALTQYKQHRFSCLDKPNAERYKKIIMELIKRSPADSLYAETVKSYISTLEEAVNTFDIEIVKAIVEKKGFDIQNLKISADELSPLYYAVSRCGVIWNLISTGKFPEGGKQNINWEKLGVPGIYTEDKKLRYKNMLSNPEFKMMEEASNVLFCGKPEIWKQELSELKEIIKYLISRTDNVDKFKKEVPSKERLTALSLAVEFDFDDICRLLLEKGANSADIFAINGEALSSPFARTVWFKSWETLEMLLADYKNKIKPIINERYGDDKYTAMHLLFKADCGPFCQYSVNGDNYKIIERFIPLFRNAGAEFDVPNAGNITVRQILQKANLGNLMQP